LDDFAHPGKKLADHEAELLAALRAHFAVRVA